MIRVYASGFSRSRRALWVLEEAAAPYEVVELEWPPKSNPEFLAINPAGTVPTIADGDLVLSESLAICDYVARKHRPDLLVQPDEPGYYAFLELLLFCESTLGVTLGWARRFGPLAPQAMADARDSFALRVDALARRLDDGREWITAGRFTVADISAGFPLILAPGVGLGDLIPPGVAAYVERLKARPANRRAYTK